MDPMDLLQGHLSESTIDQLSQSLGGEDRKKTATAAAGISSLLMGALARNASSPQGAASLADALSLDHDGSILDDVVGMVTGSNRHSGSGGIDLNRMLNGAGILSHVLGNKQSNAIDMISKMSGLNRGKTGNLMTMLAPVIMGALGKIKRQKNLGSDGLSSLLSGTVNKHSNDNPLLGMAAQFLDADGDGSIMDDLGGMGLKMLGGLFGRKR